MDSNDNGTITFTEVDELNNPTSTYIYSESSPEAASSKNEKGKHVTGRVDIAVNRPVAYLPSSKSPKKHISVSTPWSSIDSIRSLLVDVFLPAGYPHSVSEDYTPYQIFDSLQAFSSSIAGLLASRAVLQGVGVGNANASPTSALLLHILQDTSGRIATILFAHRVGTALEPECKMYRFAADIFNDLAMVLDCLSPMIPAGVSRVTVLSSAGVLRALCGVAGGSSKASLSAHFAKWGNLAEVNAKDSSQETVISLIGMLVGSLVVSHINGFAATWLTLLFLLTLHLSLNYAAVRSVQMNTLNRQRANIVFSSLLSSNPAFAGLLAQDQLVQNRKLDDRRTVKGNSQIPVLSPGQVAKQERIFDAGGALRWYPSTQKAETSEHLGSCQMGVSLKQFLAHSSLTTTLPGSNSLNTTIPLRELTDLFSDEEYILFLAPATGSSSSNIQTTILLKSSQATSSNDTNPPLNSNPNPHLKAWIHALLAAKTMRSKHVEKVSTTEDILQVLSRTLAYLNDAGRFNGYIAALREKGWDVDTDLKGGGGGGSALETRVGRRVVISIS